MFSEEKPALPAIKHIDTKDTTIKDEPLEINDSCDPTEQIESVESNERNTSDPPADFHHPIEKLELVLKEEDTNSSNDDELMSPLNLKNDNIYDGTKEPAANTRPKRNLKPAFEKYQGSLGNTKAKNKNIAKKQPTKKQETKNIISDKGRKPLQQLSVVKNCICRKCGKKFVDADLLKFHMNIHSDKRPHECKTCGKRFQSKDKLKVSEKTSAICIKWHRIQLIELNQYFRIMTTHILA